MIVITIHEMKNCRIQDFSFIILSFFVQIRTSISSNEEGINCLSLEYCKHKKVSRTQLEFHSEEREKEAEAE